CPRWSTGLSGEPPEGTALQDVPTATGSTGVHSQSRRQAASSGHPDDQRSRGADGDTADSGTDLRGGLSGLFVRISSGKIGPPGAGGDSGVPERGPPGSVRRRLAGLLRHDSTRSTDGGIADADYGPLGPASDPNVAGSSDRRTAGRRPTEGEPLET